MSHLFSKRSCSAESDAVLAALLSIFSRYVRRMRKSKDGEEVYSWVRRRRLHPRPRPRAEPRPSRPLSLQSESQDQVFLRWTSGETATMHILVVHAMVILLTLGPPRGERAVGGAPRWARQPSCPRARCRGRAVQSGTGLPRSPVEWRWHSLPACQRGFWGKHVRSSTGGTPKIVKTLKPAGLWFPVMPHCGHTLCCHGAVPTTVPRAASCTAASLPSAQPEEVGFPWGLSVTADCPCPPEPPFPLTKCAGLSAGFQLSAGPGAPGTVRPGAASLATPAACLPCCLSRSW